MDIFRWVFLGDLNLMFITMIYKINTFITQPLLYLFISQFLISLVS